MDGTGRLRDALALARGEKAAMEVELSKTQNRPLQSKSQKHDNFKKKLAIPLCMMLSG